MPHFYFSIPIDFILTLGNDFSSRCSQWPRTNNTFSHTDLEAKTTKRPRYATCELSHWTVLCTSDFSNRDSQKSCSKTEIKATKHQKTKTFNSGISVLSHLTVLCTSDSFNSHSQKSCSKTDLKTTKHQKTKFFNKDLDVCFVCFVSSIIYLLDNTRFERDSSFNCNDRLPLARLMHNLK